MEEESENHLTKPELNTNRGDHEASFLLDDVNTVKKLKDYCDGHGLEFITLPYILNEPKVTPMIRGIGYEYVVKVALEKILKNDDRFFVRKVISNPQLMVDGNDMEIYDKLLDKTISIECKLAKNNSFKPNDKNGESSPHCSVKIMRSRTMGEKVIEMVAKKGEATVEQLSAHRDSYLSNKFDFVVTNIRNAFYVTLDNDTFEFKPSEEEWSILEKYFNTTDHKKIDEDLKNLHFYARASDLSPKGGRFKCTKRECPNPTTCVFIPNYPMFPLSDNNIWSRLEDIRSDLI